jgi:site-specific recombinase XerD
MRNYIDSFLAYMKTEKIASPSTIYGYRKEIGKFIDYVILINITEINLISTSTIRQYFYYSKENRGLCQSSISKIIATIKSFFNYLEEEEIIIKNPARKIKVPKKIYRIPSVMSKYEVDLIIKSIDFAPLRCRKNNVRDKLVLSLLYYTGIRKSELLNLNWTDINLSKSFIIIRRGKGGKDRLIPLHKEVTRLLDLYLEKRLPLKTEALIIGEQGRRLCKGSFVNLLKMYFAISGLKRKGYTAHSFRHSFATHLVEAGVDLFKVQRLMGHASLDTTKIYINFNSTQMAKAVDRL